MGASIEVAVLRTTCRTTVSVSGDLDLATVGVLRARLAPVLDERPELLVLDVGALSFVDATGVQCVVEAATAVRRAGGRLVLARPSRMLRRVLHLLELEHELPVEEAAVPD
ncbi:MAG: anti-sigma factor antagonist [Frankiales bacterium]|nr:anti-sigma factor antagonist [Frankiales bacterium]